MSTSKIIEIAKGIFWVGGSGQEEGLHCNPYLIVDGDEAVLIDPGSVLDFEYVYENVCSIVPIKKIKYIILHHQDPDFCSSVPLFEKKGADFTVVTHWRTQTLVKYYDIKSDYYIINKNGYKLVLKSGRVLDFIMTPYLHFAGSITTYDSNTKVLFSSDLFGAFSYDWNIYAQENYIDKMKTFHEHYMPSNDILRPVMEVFLGMDISIIAPQHGSVIKDNVKHYIRVLRDLECGTLLTPIKKDIVKSGGYKTIFNIILKRLSSVFGSEEILDAIKGIDITLDENLVLVNYNYTSDTLWNLIFEKILDRKGLNWLIVIEPLIRTLAIEYDLSIPKVFETSLIKAEGKAENLNKENEMLKDINAKLTNNLKEAENKLIRCPVTGLYNYNFFKSYLSNEIKSMFNEEGQNPCLLVISLDEIGKFRYAYGDNEVEEVIKNTAYILNSLKDENDVYFRLEGPQFVCYIPHSTKEKAVALAEKIRVTIASSNKFIMKITASIGVVCLDELREEHSYINNLDEVIYNIALMRVRIAKNQGMNIVCNNSSVEEYQEETKKILLVDTDAVNIDVIKTLLENINFNVITANDGEDALSLMDKHSFNLIVSEIMIPKIDGFTVREKLMSHSNTKKIPFIIISHLKDDNSVQRAATLGVENYFKKPFILSEFLGVVKNKIKGESNQ